MHSKRATILGMVVGLVIISGVMVEAKGSAGHASAARISAPRVSTPRVSTPRVSNSKASNSKVVTPKPVTVNKTYNTYHSGSSGTSTFLAAMAGGFIGDWLFEEISDADNQSSQQTEPSVDGGYRLWSWIDNNVTWLKNTLLGTEE